MPAVTVYVVQPFRRRVRELTPGPLHQFSSLRRAVAFAEELARVAPAVEVFSVTGDPSIDLWGDPVFVAVYGESGVDLRALPDAA